LTHASIAQIELPASVVEAMRREESLPLLRSLAGDAMTSTVRGIQRCEDALGVGSEPYQKTFSATVRLDNSLTLLPRFYRPDLVSIERELTDRFVCLPLGDLADITRGAGTHSKEYSSVGMPFVSPGVMTNWAIDMFPQHRASTDIYETHGQSIGEGDILLAIEGKVGPVALLGADDDCVAKNHVELVRLRPDAPITREFLFAFLASNVGQSQIYRRTVVQTTIPGLGSGSRSILIPIDTKRALDGVGFRRAGRRIRADISTAIRTRTELKRLLQEIIQRVIPN
jgi:hypothetical protein